MGLNYMEWLINLKAVEPITVLLDLLGILILTLVDLILRFL